MQWMIQLLGFVALAKAGWPPIHNPDGTMTFDIYRAIDHTSQYAKILENCNAANAAGVLGYLHPEVIPLDMHPNEPTRKFKIDVIVKFRVNVKNPPKFGPYGFGSFQAYDSGKCTVPNCDQIHAQDGYFVGYQNQDGNPRHGYTNGFWFSFPQPGLCEHPTGAPDCTYSYVVTGILTIDQLSGTLPNYKAFIDKGGVEFSRASRDPPGCCTTIRSVSYWRDPCDKQRCEDRVSQLENFPTGLNCNSSVSCVLCNTDFYGGDVGSTYADNAATCQSRCVTNPQCTKWTWVALASRGDYKTCYMKNNDAGAPNPASCCESGPRVCQPTQRPTSLPTLSPTSMPTVPTSMPTTPTSLPTSSPSPHPTSQSPSPQPTSQPTTSGSPTTAPKVPTTARPSSVPTRTPTAPTNRPTQYPTQVGQTFSPTQGPTARTTSSPTPDASSQSVDDSTAGGGLSGSDTAKIVAGVLLLSLGLGGLVYWWCQRRKAQHLEEYFQMANYNDFRI